MPSGMDRTQFRQDLNDINYVGRRSGLSLLAWLFIGLAVIGVIGAVVWGVKVATSDVKGAGDAARQGNSAANRLQAQAKYSQLYEGVRASDRNITVLAHAAAQDPTVFNKTNLVGAQNVCQQQVAEYNAMATNVLTAKWRPAELPSRVGDDTFTDCQPDPIPSPSK